MNSCASFDTMNVQLVVKEQKTKINAVFRNNKFGKK
jgi:hypothetical protein